MNETRKAIIELIEPYMDGNNGLHALYNELNKSEFEYNSEIYYIDDFNICYDITAVEKYFMSLGYVIITHQNHKEISNYGFNDGFGTFPNKPLHLYTEQEEKELLELLKKLK